MSGGSISFDRAAGYYDSTRPTDPRAMEETVAVLAGLLHGRLLEIGVGTGALALPFARLGRPIVGIDISAAMLEKLVLKAAPGPPPPLVRADATRLPFADDAFGGAYARWVLHLISGWTDAVAELCRVVEPGGVIAVEPGGYQGMWIDVWLRFLEVLGDKIAPPGLDAVRRHEVLGAAFTANGAEDVGERRITNEGSISLASFLDGVERRAYSWTWAVPDDELAAAVEVVRAWAEARWGDLTSVAPGTTTRWRTFRVRD